MKQATIRWTWVSRVLSTLISPEAVVALFHTSANAQGGRAGINGTVTDQTGGLVAGAQISAKNMDTGQTTTVTSGSEGSYSFSFLPIGRYQITATHPGFTTETETGVTLSVDESASANFSLKPGQVSTSVEVKAEAQELETT